MKKNLKKLLSLCLCLLLAAGTTAPALASILGDVTNDDGVTAEDARGILRAAVGLDALSEEEKAAADMDNDGAVTAADARLALRVAVGLNQTVDGIYANQYEILRSGRFYAELDNGGYDGASMSFVCVGNRRLFDVNLEGMSTSIYTDGESLVFIDQKHGIYSEIDEDTKEFLGEDGDFFGEMLDMISQFSDFGELPPLSEAVSSQTETLDGKEYTSYWFMGADGTLKVYMDGVKLKGLQRVNKQGRPGEAVVFSAVSAVIPTLIFSFKDAYTFLPDFMSFMIVAFGELLGAGKISEEDIQAILEEARNA